MYYVTFGCGTEKAGCYTEVDAVSYEVAESVVQHVVGGKYSTIYTEKEFAGQIEKWGLRKIPLGV